MKLYTQPDLVECIPNLSLGQDRKLLMHACQAITTVDGTKLLHVESNSDAQRSVFTYVGTLDAVTESSTRLIDFALDHIDMSVHEGAHPHIGAVDVCPYVNIGTRPDSQLISNIYSWAHDQNKQFDVPVYLYEKSASKEDRKNLANFRRGNYKKLKARMLMDDWRPDFGNILNPKFGAMVAGLRDLLVAVNFSLPGMDIAQARDIAAQIRQSSDTEYSLPGVKAIGWSMPSYNSVQVSVNITRLELVSLYQVISTIILLAKNSPSFTGYRTELIGLMPQFYMESAIADFGCGDYADLRDHIQLLTQAPGIPTIEYQMAHTLPYPDLVIRSLCD